ncbi:unnamed protein product [Adineta steineri]|uniref:Uncharacterized protein n=1 Tax=Adineta steineri TaxID=433720 RepID=A0A815X4V4_9BILA|nr:unnamed protein product [Adineta steineri]CAF1549794.1 unnamed protein product [Adineta steineri]CAF1660753.1 unnamed protein product [Adineta steineri]CAF1660766.1 unnamed protein product [Adineta steineri]
MINSTQPPIIRKNNHHFHSQIPSPMTLNRSINETTCTTVTNIPCHLIKHKQSHEKSSKIEYHTIPTSFLHQPSGLKKTSSNLCNIFHSLSFDNIPSTNTDDDDPIISDEYQINLTTNNEQFQELKKQFHTYLNDIQFNILSRVIELLSLCNHLNDEQIKDLLHKIGLSNIDIDDINRFKMNDRRRSVNERFKNLQNNIK